MDRIIVKRNGLPDLPLRKRGALSILNASLTREMLNNDFVQIKVKTADILDVKINDTIEVDGRVYRMNTPPEWIQQGDRNYEYDLKFEGQMYDLTRVIFKNMDGSGYSPDLEFSSVGNIEHFLTIIINNISRYSPIWEIGKFENVETKTLSFSNESCLSALQRICTEFKIEFRIDYDKTKGKYIINTGSFGEEFPYTFSYGKGKGLYTLSLKNIDQRGVINRLYVNGGAENLPVGYRNYSDKLKFSDDGYIEDTSLIQLMGLFEGVANFNEIFPHRKGKISKVVSRLSFTDDSMDFDLMEKNADGSTKYLNPAQSAKVSFLTGDLAGYQFELTKKDGYDHSKKQFTIIQQKNDKNLVIPDDTGAFAFKEGDEYTLLDIAMPETYINNSEAELSVEGHKELEKVKQALVQYDLQISPLFMKSLTNGIGKINFDIGDYIRIVHTKLGINKLIRVNSVVKDLMQDSSYTITVSDEFNVNDVRQLFYDVKTIQTTLQLTGALNVNRSMLGYRTTEELKNLVFDPDNYFDPDNIRPFSIETNMLSVGARSQQISCSSTFSLNELGDANRVVVSMGQLFSQTIGKIWNIGAQTYNVPDNDFRYIYAKCSKNNNSGVMHLTQEQIKFDSDVNDYYFLIGILHPVNSGSRILSITVGSTTIVGGMIRTGIIQDLSGTNYFNLDTGEIKGNISFNINSPAFQQVANSLQIGATNILRHSDFLQPDGYYSPWAYGLNGVIEWLPGVLKMTSSEFTTGGSVGIGISAYGFDFSKIRNKVLTLTYKVRSNVYSNINSGVFSYNGMGDVLYNEKVNVGPEWTVIKIIFKTLDVPYDNFYFYVWQSEGAVEFGQTIEMKEPMLEWGNVSSDWSLAPEDVTERISLANQNAINAQNTANQAQQSANVANAMLNDISSDNKLTPSEKQQLKTQWESIKAEYPTTRNQGIYYNLSTVDYDNSYNNLNAYITDNGLLSDLTTTTDIDGNLFRYYFVEYFTKKVSLLKEISDRAKNLADQAQLTADQAKQNALNAQNSANNAQQSANTANALLTDIASDNKLTPLEKQQLKTEWVTIVNEKPIVNQQANYYALSTGAYDNAFNVLNSYINDNGLLNDLTTTTDINGETLRNNFSNYYTEKVNLLKAISDKAKQLADQAQSTANNANLTAQQAQQGVINMQVSLDDVKTKTDNFISINGGLLMGNIISVGDNQLNQRAFISGVTDAGDNSIRFGAGANYADKNNAPFKVLDNGKLFASDASIKGHIEATTGQIGGFKIQNNLMIASTSPTLNPWELNSSYTSIAPDRMMFRSINNSVEDRKEVIFGVTSSPSTGTMGAMAVIRANNIDTLPYSDNTALILEAKGSVKNTALNIRSGDILLEDTHVGWTVDMPVPGSKILFYRFVKGILVGTVLH